KERSDIVCVLICLCGLHADVLVCDLELVPPGWREPLDCVRASEMCNQNSQCSSRYRIMRQCLSGGDKERSAMLASKECQGALEVLQDSPLYDCRCKRGMKKELQCLQNYWSIHLGLTEGKVPYSEAVKKKNSSKPCNPCLDAAKACNLNDTCKRLRSSYTTICSKATPPQPSLANHEACSRKRCQKVCKYRCSSYNWNIMLNALRRAYVRRLYGQHMSFCTFCTKPFCCTSAVRL
uniref:GDNF family receptor alpha 2b n=1 Tax=Neogobius melanostomus TaxID=47308 RepID=A0A8C6T943_9GOBI